MAPRLILTPDPISGGYVARLDGDHVVTSRQPVVDGARVLLRRGHSPDALLTARHAGAADSFKPLPIREWARWTYTDGVTGRLQRIEWTPMPKWPAARAAS
jgi:hypothetical protein